VQGKEEIFSTIFSKIFDKGLSDHSVGTFQLLSSEVGLSFEAVLARGNNRSLDSIVSVSSQESSISAIISQLREENERLNHQKEELVKQATAEREQRLIAEERVHQLCGEQALLETQLQQQTDRLALLQDIVTKCAADLHAAVPIRIADD
jgi:predicted nuclease with TOPRIM domain